MKVKKDNNFFYNPRTLKFEKKVQTISEKLYNILGFVSVAITTGIIIILIFGKYWESIQIKFYKNRLKEISYKYEFINKEITDFRKQLGYLEKRDNEIYRTIFQANNIEDSLNELELINNKSNLLSSYNMGFSTLYEEVENNVKSLRNKVNNQIKSYAEIDNLIKNKEAIFRATPAIQPISNEDLSRIASGFGYRIDPIYKTEKFHEGLDFTAPNETSVYATADGIIEKMEYNGGYGNHIIINHGFGYKTLYGHMSAYKTYVGKKVKRGEVIGLVGNTGKSTGPHCHYEVIKNNVKVNPVYYFFNDLSAEQFQKITTIANQRNQSLD